ERAEVLDGQSAEDRRRHGAGRAQQTADRRTTFGSYAEPANSPVAGILFPTHHAMFHESIDEPGHGGYGHLQLQGKPVTGGPIRIDRDHGEYLELLHRERSRDQRLGHRGKGTALETVLYPLQRADQLVLFAASCRVIASSPRHFSSPVGPRRLIELDRNALIIDVVLTVSLIRRIIDAIFRPGWRFRPNRRGRYSRA